MRWITFFALIVSTTSIAQIKVYFNHSVDHNASSITDAQYSSHLEDTIVKLIDETNTTLEIAVWDNGSSAIVSALNAAHARGVAVRYISSSNSTNSALSGLNAAIPYLERNSGLTSNVMHNKFIVSDHHKVLMGSMNFGMGSMVDDYNNIVIIDDASLANNYLIEFNEMWGASSGNPNTTNSRFGPDKLDNTTHQFTINGSQVGLYFSPSDQTTQQIVNAIDQADHTLEVAMFTFINNDLGDAVIAAEQRGVNVRAIIENVGYIGSEYNGLVNAGVSVQSHATVSYDFHHKYCVIDANYPASDPVVVTGSHNWTNSAETEYDENTLIIHDAIVAGMYLEEFNQRFNELNGTAELSESKEATVQVLQTTDNKLIFLSEGKELTKCVLMDLSGSVLSAKELTGFFDYLTIDHLPTGVYFVQVETKEGYQEVNQIVIR